VVIFNINLKGKNSIDLLRHIKHNNAKVCLLLSYDDKEALVSDSVLTDTNCIIYNDKTNNALTQEINQVIYDGKKINARVTKRILSFISKPQLTIPENPIPLTTREIELMNLIAQGYSNMKVAEELGITVQTVKNHLKKIFTRLNVKTRAEAIMIFTHNH
jgi:DNA-binding NarL/FixJ family response regulator